MEQNDASMMTRRQKAAAVLVAMRRKPYEPKRSNVYVECGCCSQFHRSDFHGDCRDNSERFGDPPEDARIIYLDDGPSMWAGEDNARRRRLARARKNQGQQELYTA